MADKAIKKIVIVDDDETIRKTFFLILNDRYRVYPARNAREALQRFHQTGMDLIITDMRLSDSGGMEMISKFRDLGYSGEVILISGFPDNVDVDELQKLSIGYYFSKPLDLGALNDAVDYLLDSKKWHEKRVSQV